MQNAVICQPILNIQPMDLSKNPASNTPNGDFFLMELLLMKS